MANQHHDPNRRARILFAGWIGAAVFGMLGLHELERRPTATSTPPVSFPVLETMPREEKAPILIVFLHPHCPCSAATLNELEHIVSRTLHRASVKVVFWHPEQTSGSWHLTKLWHRASRIPGIEVINDNAGKLANAFLATSSGQAMLYDSEGTLRYNGGITIARGHEGDNAGRQAILSLINKPYQPHRMEYPVYGCSIRLNEAVAGRGSIEGDEQ